ncbi:hypothetical protein NQ318_021012 [Aromia moschata]|uniref:Uncharacterized protein n=1 Tax=Aromia moschata TaxID=1265417 RepID=A0AAV8YP90_9CUCU|nr:hypothetical protein NQ318_021012 [Aromia moschata]
MFCINTFFAMSEIITLSSDEESSPPKKRIKPTHVGEVSITPVKKVKDSENIVVLSDDDDCIEEKTVPSFNCVINKENMEQCVTMRDDDNDSVTFIDEHDLHVDNNKNREDSSTPENIGKNNSEDIVGYSITIEGSSAEESSGKENISENALLQNNNITEPGTSKNSSNDLLEKFLTVCEESIIKSQYEHFADRQFPIIRKYYKKFGTKLSESLNFSKLIEENIERARKSPAAGVISFNEVFQYIKELVDAESVEVSEEHKIKLKKLEKNH